MSKSVKFISGIMAFSMALSLMMPKTFAYKVNTDVVGTVYEEAATTLGALGIMIGDDTGLFRPEDAVTRAEFSKIAVHLLGLEDTAKTAQGISKFPDVATSHWANGYINVATSQKIIVGDDTGLFRPDDKISYQEAVTILVRALGYEYVANSKGGYPTGFLVTGVDTGITKKTSSLGIDPCKRGTTAQMTFNSLTVNLMEPTGYTQGENITYQVTDKTLLTHKLGVVKNTGVVTGNSVTKLTSSNSLNKNQVEIDSKEIFDEGQSNAGHYLGYNITYYVKEDNGVKTIILAQKDASKNEEVTIPVDQLSQEIKEDSTSVFHRPDEDSKETEYVLEAEKKVIYNDKFASKLKNPATGTVKIIDTDKNGKYDVVFIDEYVNYIVDDIAPASKKIYDKNGKTALDLNTENNKKLTVILENKDGEEVKFEDIKEWDVLSVFKNDDYIRVVVTNEYVEGKITEKATDSHKVVIDETEYHVAGDLDFDLLKLDLEGVFYLDMNGDIAAFNAQYKKGSNYAYLINAGVDGSLDSTLSIKFFNENGETQTLKAAEKIKIDDKTGFDALNGYNELSENGKGVTPQIFTYELNSKGEITLIDRAEDKTASFPESFEKTQFALNFKGEDLVFKKSTNKFNKLTDGSVTQSIGVNEDTVIFNIATGEKDTEKMEMVTLDMLSDGSEYDIEVFDMSEDMTAKVIRITNAVSIGKLNAPVAIVEKVTAANNGEGNKIDKLYAVTEGEKIEITTADSSTLEKAPGVKVQAGDIIQFTKNAKGELDSFTLLFDTNSKTTEFTKEYGSDGEMSVVYGKVTKKFTDSVNISVNDKASINYSTKDAVVYKVNTAKTNNKITVTDAGEISKWEDDANEVRLFLRIYEDEVKEIVIVE